MVRPLNPILRRLQYAACVVPSLAIALVALQAAPPAAASAPPIEHVLVVSVDGLRPDALEGDDLASRLPAFARLLRGAHTLDARTDAEYTVTLPNHISMVTGRPVHGPHGHLWTDNTDPPALRDLGSLHARKGTYVTSMFDIAHDAGIATGFATSKTKFWLFEQSYGWEAGGIDTTGADNGRAKIDAFLFAEHTIDLAGAVADRLRRHAGRSLDFAHFAAPDIAGHSYDWDMRRGSRYLAAIEEVDRGLALILDAIEGDAELRGRTAILLTADHGGGVPRRTHTDITCPLNFRVPFIAWVGGDRTPADLYELNPTRARPGREEIGERDANPQPIRNGDVANAAMQLLGLPSVYGSFYGALEPLRTSSPAP
jgi:predicted AlkP superfamily pyrophosphatase or phosphodiesterase